jgi:hypothetical protein
VIEEKMTGDKMYEVKMTGDKMLSDKIIDDILSYVKMYINK